MNAIFASARPLRSLLRLGTAAALAAVCSLASAADWPTKPIKLVVCFPPGNSADVFARGVAPRLSTRLGQPVVVENRGGAGGLIGVDAIAKAQADDHTFGVCSLSPLTIMPSVRRKMPYDVEQDLLPVVLSNRGPMVLLVRKEAPFNTLQELIAHSRANPGKLTYASLGPGTISQMSTEAFKLAAGADIVEVSYKGSGPALTDLIGGHVDIMLDGATSASTQLAAGTVKALAVTTRQRSPLLPQVPTMHESGLEGLKGFDFFGWVGFIAPRASSPQVVQRLNQEINEILRQPALQQLAQTTGQEIPEPGTPEQFRAFMREDRARWADIARRLKLELE